jgi:hypothetical protein
MSESSLFANLLATWLIAGMGVIAQLQGNGPELSGQRFGASLRFMAEAYPDVVDVSGRVQMVGSVYHGVDLREFGLQWNKGIDVGPFGGTNRASSLCFGSFVFMSNKLVEYRAVGECTQSATNEALQRSLRTASTWTPEEVDKQLERVNASFGRQARDAVLNRLPSRLTLSELVSEPLEFVRLDFVMPRPDADATTQPAYVLHWLAKYQAAQRREIEILVAVEPLGGRLSAISRHPPE